MGYNKLIIYGKNIESYQYENDVFFNGRQGKRISRVFRSDDLVSVLSTVRKNDRVRAVEQKRRADNAKRASVAFRRIVSANLAESHNPIFLTLTYANYIDDPARGYSDFRAFISALRYRFGKKFRYVAVPEFQKSGRIHFHALLWDLPESLVDTERQTRFVASLWGLGFIDMIRTDGHEKLAGYIAKYMSKVFCDVRLKNNRAYVCSRNIKRPEFLGGVENISWVLDDYLGVDNYPLQTKEFLTQWLGKCIYKHYNFIK